jgi:hypothetical protein
MKNAAAEARKMKTDENLSSIFIYFQLRLRSRVFSHNHLREEMKIPPLFSPLSKTASRRPAGGG